MKHPLRPFWAWLDRSLLHAEAGLVFLLIIGLVVWSELFGGKGQLAEVVAGSRSTLYATTASVFGALLGFVIASIAIVLTVAGSRRLTILRRSKAYEKLWLVFRLSMWSLGSATLAAVIGLIADDEDDPAMWALYLNAATTAYATIMVVTVLWVLDGLVRIEASTKE